MKAVTWHGKEDVRVQDVPEPLLTDDDPLGTADLRTHSLPLEQAPEGYEMFQKKDDGAIKVVLKP